MLVFEEKSNFSNSDSATTRHLLSLHHHNINITKMASSEVVTSIDASSIGLKKIASGKVREIFEVDQNTLLFVASDRISAYDVILGNVSE